MRSPAFRGPEQNMEPCSHGDLSAATLEGTSLLLLLRPRSGSGKVGSGETTAGCWHLERSQGLEAQRDGRPHHPGLGSLCL